jgi:hypothetical protein
MEYCHYTLNLGGE